MAKSFDVNATNEELEVFAASAAAPVAPEKKKANVFYRLLAFVLAAFPILFFFFHPFVGGTVFDGYVYIVNNILDYLQGWFGNGVETIVYSLPTVALPFVMLACAIMAIVALFSGKAAPKCARAIAWLGFWSIGAVILSEFTLYYFMGATGSELITMFEEPYFLYHLYIAGGMGLIGWILSVVNSPKKVWFSTILFIFALAFNVVIVYMLRLFADDFTTLYESTLGMIYYYATLAIIVFSTLGMLITSGLLGKKKGFGGNLFVTIVHIVVTVALLVAYLVFWQNGQMFNQRLDVAGQTIQFSGFVACLILLGAISVLELIISIVRLCVKEKAKKAVVDAPVEKTAESEDAPVEEANEEIDYVEATPYQPVAEAYYDDEEVVEEVEEVEEEEEEEEVAPVAQPAPAPVAPVAPAAPATPGETKLDDPFIATLTDEERKKFADVFILKSQGEFPGVPDYKTGEDNSAFFRKIFVYLGKYRARIPDDLLAKIYDYSISK